MWYCGVDVAYQQLSNWTSLQWALHMQWVSPFSAVRVGDAALRKLLWDFWFAVLSEKKSIVMLK